MNNTTKPNTTTSHGITIDWTKREEVRRSMNQAKTFGN
jgi:hypothetical protein